MKILCSSANLAHAQHRFDKTCRRAVRLAAGAACGFTIAAGLSVISYAAEEPGLKGLNELKPGSAVRSGPTNPADESSTAATLSAPDAAVIQALRQFLTRSISAQGSFEQRIVREGAPKDAVSSGRFRFQRPGRYAWLTDLPYPQSILSDGQTLQVFDPALNQLTLRPMQTGDAASAAVTPVDLLFGRLPPGRDPLVAWHIGAASAPPGARRFLPASAAWHWIALAPRQQSSRTSEAPAYHNVLLGLEAGVPQWLSFDDDIGQHLQIRLHWQPAPTLSAKDFRIEAPAGVDVIDMRPSH